MYVDQYKGIHFSLREIYPIIKKTLLQFDEIKDVIYWFAPSDLKIKNCEDLAEKVINAYQGRMRYDMAEDPIEKKIVREIENLENLADAEFVINNKNMELGFSKGASLLDDIDYYSSKILIKTKSGDIICYIKDAIELAKRLSNSSAMKSDKVYNKVVAEFIDVIKENLVKYRDEIDTMCTTKKKIKPVLVNYIIGLNSLKSKIESECNSKPISTELESKYFNIEKLKGKLLKLENEINLLDTELLKCNSVIDMNVKLNDYKNNTLINFISLAEAKKEISQVCFLIENTKFASSSDYVKSKMVFNKARECLKSIGHAEEFDECISKLCNLRTDAYEWNYSYFNDTTPDIIFGHNPDHNIVFLYWVLWGANVEAIKTKHLEFGINEYVKKGIKDCFCKLSKSSLSGKYSYKLIKLRLLYEEKFKDTLFDGEERIFPESEKFKKEIHKHLNKVKKRQKELIDFLKSIDEDPKNYGCDMRVFDDIDME